LRDQPGLKGACEEPFEVAAVLLEVDIEEEVAAEVLAEFVEEVEIVDFFSSSEREDSSADGTCVDPFDDRVEGTIGTGGASGSGLGVGCGLTGEAIFSV